MKKKLFSLAAITVAACLLVTGCGAPTAPTAPGASKAASENKTESTGGKTEITFLDVMPSPERTALLEDLISRFEEENQTISVKYTSVPWDEAYKKLVAMGSSKTLPDVITSDVGIMQSLARPGYLLNLDDKFNSLPAKGDFSESTLAAKQSYSYDGSVYSVPDGWLTQGIFVRTDWLEEAGYKIEDLKNWTWDQYFEVIEKLTDPAKGRYGIAFRGGANGGLRFFEYLGSMLEVTGAFPGNDNKSIYSDPKALEYFEKFYGLYIDGYAPQDSINWGFKEMVEGFITGQCATLNQTPEVTVTAQQSMEEGTWTVLPQPVKPGAAKNSVVWGYSGAYSISANSKNPDAAWKFIEWLSSPEINLEYSQRFGCMPLYKSSLNDPFFQEGVMKGYADALLDPNIQYLAQPGELSQWGFFLSEYFKNESQKYMAGQQTAEQTLENAAKWMSEQYDNDIASKA